MAAKSTRSKKAPTGAATAADDVPVVGPREPCPCGSGKRYKACHGKAAQRASTALVRRPFAGLPGECDWVALREIVPAATATVTLTGGREVVVATLLPLGWPALVRKDGGVYVGLQTTLSSGDPSRDVAHALEQALESEPGTAVEIAGLPGPGARLQDLVDPASSFDVDVREGFVYWVEGFDTDEQADAVIEAANAALVPTRRLASADAAYWCRMGPKEHLRWVLPHDEEAVLDALARLHELGADSLGKGSRYVGAFRAHGLIVPVWDLAPGAEADDVEEPMAVLAERLADTLADPRPLTADERRTRARLQSRQVTLR